MIRLLLVLFTLVGFLIFSYPFLVAQVSLGKKDPHARDLETIKVVRSVFKVLLKLAGVTVTVKGAENIPEDTAVLYVGNHRSYFDILAGYTTVPTLLGFVAKKEMEKIPLLRTWMVNVNCLFLDRKNIKEGLKMILQGIEKVKKGVSIWIFPEGTRNRDREDTTTLLPFKDGSFKIAQKTGCPIIPMALTGTADIFENHFPWLHSTEVKLTYGEPIILSELSKEDQKHIGVYCQNVIHEMLQEHKNTKE